MVTDLGAGDGTLLAGLLTGRPGLRAIAVEQPSVIAALLERAGFTVGRTEVGPSGMCLVEGAP